MMDRQRRGAFASLSSLWGAGKQEEKVFIRPPYNGDKRLLSALCPTCSDTLCIRACEEDIIVLDNAKIPCLLFTKSGCTFCEECAKACPYEVLHVGAPAVIEARFSINIQKCLAWNETICNSCLDVCNHKAINFFGMFRPQIVMDNCTGCGFCYGVCPTQAVAYKGVV